MTPYILMFCASTFFIALGRNVELQRKDHLLALCFYLIALVFPCALAGARDLTIGTDTSGYGIYIYETGIYSRDFSDFYQTLDRSIWDIGWLYGLFSYFVIQMFGSQFAYFFCIELAVILPVFIVVRKYCGKRMPICFLIYLLVMYIPSLNIMRQSVAVGFSLLAVMKFIDGNKVLGVVIGLASVLIHTSALICFFFMLLWIILINEDKVSGGYSYRKWSQIVLLIVVIIAVIISIFFRQIAAVFDGIPMLHRMTMYALGSGDALSNSEFVDMALFLLGSLALFNLITVEDRYQALFYICVLVLRIPVFFLSGISVTIARMADYCTVFILPYIGLLPSKLPKRLSSVLGYSCIIIGAVFIFFYCYVFRRYNAAVPYSSSMLNL